MGFLFLTPRVFGLEPRVGLGPLSATSVDYFFGPSLPEVSCWVEKTISSRLVGVFVFFWVCFGLLVDGKPPSNITS